MADDFRACVVEQLAAAGISKSKAEKAIKRYDNLRESYTNQGLSEADAEGKAGADAITRATVELEEAAKRKTAHFMAAMRIDGELRASGRDPGLVAQAFIDADARLPIQNYAALRDTVRGQFHAVLSDLIQKYQPKFAGLWRDGRGQENIVRELFGHGTDDSVAKGFAKAWEEATDLGVHLWNVAGGTLLKRGDWRLPQYQSPVRLAKAGRGKWIADHEKWLDWANMRHEDGRPIDPSEHEKLLNGVFETISTDGAVNLQRRPGKGALGNTFDQTRFLQFKNADAWLEMHATYGEGSIFEVMMTHLEDRAHRIAMIKRFGPNPSMMRDIITSAATRIAGERDAAISGPRTTSALDTTEKNLQKFSDMFDVVSRRTKMAGGNVLGASVAGIRNILTSAQLGSAALLAIPGDFGTTLVNRYFNGMPMAAGIGFYFRLWKDFGGSVEGIARRAGFVHDNAVAMAYGAERFNMMNTFGPAMTKRISDTVLRASWLSGHTQAARWTGQMEMLGLFADHAPAKFDDLPFKAVFERHGISSRDWDTFRALKPWEPEKGAHFLRPSDLLDGSRQRIDLHDKFMTMVIDESKLMVPDATIRGQTTLRGNTRPGTLVGELASSFAMYKNFPVSFMMMYGRRALVEASTRGKLSYIAALGIAMTGVGAMATQMREVLNGREPISMDRPEFWGQAALSGGALGIYGDFLFSGVNRFGQGLEETIAGPVFSALNDWREFTVGNAMQLAQGKDTHFWPEAIQIARRTLPGTSLWQARLVLQRTIFDQLQKEADPRAYSKFRRMESKQYENYGNRYWWHPGDASPRD